MANDTESRGTGSGKDRESGSGSGNPRTEGREPTGGGMISRNEDTSGRVGGEGQVSQQSNSNTDGGEPSRQTSTAQDESGQL